VRSLDIDPDEFGRHCEGFCASTLWPLYHDMVVPAEFDRTWWDAYRSVNARFAQAADDAAGFGATVWVHDYHLQLVPEMLRSQRPDVRIGFFNHLPFPPKELFAQLPSRTAIAEGMLRADVIGFQLDSDAQNFRSCALAFSDIDVDRSETVLDSFPMSIDAPAIHDCAESPTTALQARELRAQFGAPETLLLGIDRLEHTKGILQRLLAYEELSEEGALGTRATTLLQTAVPAGDAPANRPPLTLEWHPPASPRLRAALRGGSTRPALDHPRADRGACRRRTSHADRAARQGRAARRPDQRPLRNTGHDRDPLLSPFVLLRDPRRAVPRRRCPAGHIAA